MGHSNVWNSHPKSYGPGSRACRVCGNPHAIIRKYGLMCCRQCFRSNAKQIGFIKSYLFSILHGEIQRWSLLTDRMRSKIRFMPVNSRSDRLF
ncbi:hypothetical protein FCM35_KLT02099 [Carex littledalei]|uniref:40S ribosomal protein S29 n=1 Tax=Carex littledalei TaxID=544730 RepID=A0A833R3I4_9POAL|nr:hypothetical protein FCM35_KLT02099 [Carex littledalei]